jgi:transcriptional regulator with XRE-family HTH domain
MRHLRLPLGVLKGGPVANRSSIDMAIIRKTLERYEDHDLGLPYPVIVRDAAVAEIDDESSETLAISIPHLDYYFAAVALARALHPLQLGGADMRFMRKVLGMKAKDFAARIPIAAATYSRYENDREATSDFVDQLIRHYVCAELAEKVEGIDFHPKMITHMKRLPRSAEAEEPKIELVLVRLKSPGTSSRIEWAAAA